MNIYADHWLYRYIPRNYEEMTRRPWWQSITFRLLGNRDDGIFGEGPKSGTKWTESWGGRTVKALNIHNPGEINFKRFVLWQLRNPLHEFTTYVIGFKGKQNVSYRQILLLATNQLGFCRSTSRPEIFPMKDRTGIYFGLHNWLPFVSWRVNLLGIRFLESYSGWRPGGAWSCFSIRLKRPVDILRS